MRISERHTPVGGATAAVLEREDPRKAVAHSGEEGAAPQRRTESGSGSTRRAAKERRQEAVGRGGQRGSVRLPLSLVDAVAAGEGYVPADVVVTREVWRNVRLERSV
jgi:hypothetical protein